MKVVVLAGGTSTERAVSIVSGTGICTALRQKGHLAVLVDIFCGTEVVDWENPFPEEYDVEQASAYMKSFDEKIREMQKVRRNFLDRMCLSSAGRLILCSWGFTAPMVRTERYRQLLI